VKQEVLALRTAISFSISVDEGNLALMRQVIQDGVEASVGLKSGSARIFDVSASQQFGNDTISNKSLLSAGRQLEECSMSTISLEIQSAGVGVNSPELAQLEFNFKEACTEGSLSTHVKVAAARMNILTQCLKDQSTIIPEPYVEKHLVQRARV
jgi:hypothetical protein